MTSPQADLFGGPPLEPTGLRYVGAMVDEAERDRLTDAFAVLPFAQDFCQKLAARVLERHVRSVERPSDHLEDGSALGLERRFETREPERHCFEALAPVVLPLPHDPGFEPTDNLLRPDCRDGAEPPFCMGANGRDFLGEMEQLVNLSLGELSDVFLFPNEPQPIDPAVNAQGRKCANARQKRSGDRLRVGVDKARSVLHQRKNLVRVLAGQHS